MEIVEEVPTTKKVVKRYCDDCGSEVHWVLKCSAARCGTCGKELCDECIGHEIESPGDYRIVYCKSCDAVYKKYKPDLDRLDKERKTLIDQYHAEAQSLRKDHGK